jgi:hypothetical protein
VIHSLWARLADWYCEDVEWSSIGHVGWVPLSYDEAAKKAERDSVTTLIARGFAVPVHLVAQPDPWPGFRRWPKLGVDFKISDMLPTMRADLAKILYR